jgi:uncharacterized membrane protein YkvA (DUF1232 family)
MPSWWLRAGLLRSAWSDVRLAARLAREPRVPWLTKMLPLLAVLYVVSPLDIAPDILPGLGQLDDIGVVLIALKLFLRLCPAWCVAFHREESLKGRPYSPASPHADIIEAEFRHG